MSFPYRKRTFLSPASSRTTSYIYAEVESNEGGTLTLADSHRPPIHLEFFLGNAEDRKHSLAKIDLLIEVLTAFRDALHAEAQLIAKERRSDSGNRS